MPTILRVGSMRFFFYAADGEEPPHVHVEDDGKIAKIWLREVAVARSGYFSERQMTEALRIVQRHRDELLEKWDEFFRP